MRIVIYIYHVHRTYLILMKMAVQLSSACEKLKLKSALVIGVESDFLFPIHQQKELADHLKKSINNTEFVALDCIKGHDSFLLDESNFLKTLSSSNE